MERVAVNNCCIDFYNVNCITVRDISFGEWLLNYKENCCEDLNMKDIHKIDICPNECDGEFVKAECIILEDGSTLLEYLVLLETACLPSPPDPCIGFTAGTATTSDVCNTLTSFDLTTLTSSLVTGGTWSGSGVSATGIFDPSSLSIGSNTFSYEVTNSDNCTDTLIVIVNITDCVPPDPCDSLILDYTVNESGFTLNGVNTDNIHIEVATYGFGKGTFASSNLSSIGDTIVLPPGTYDIEVIDSDFGQNFICEQITIEQTVGCQNTYTGTYTNSAQVYIVEYDGSDTLEIIYNPSDVGSVNISDANGNLLHQVTDVTDYTFSIPWTSNILISIVGTNGTDYVVETSCCSATCGTWNLEPIVTLIDDPCGTLIDIDVTTPLGTYSCVEYNKKEGVKFKQDGCGHFDRIDLVETQDFSFFVNSNNVNCPSEERCFRLVIHDLNCIAKTWELQESLNCDGVYTPIQSSGLVSCACDNLTLASQFTVTNVDNILNTIEVQFTNALTTTYNVVDFNIVMSQLMANNNQSSTFNSTSSVNNGTYLINFAPNPLTPLNIDVDFNITMSNGCQYTLNASIYLENTVGAVNNYSATLSE